MWEIDGRSVIRLVFLKKLNGQRVACLGRLHIITLWSVYLLESNFFWKVNSEKVNSRKVNYFPIFDSVMENKLEKTFQCLDMSWKMS
jgi:hypothetical protein